MKGHRAIIAGSRTFSDWAVMCEEMDPRRKHIAEVVSGGATGADWLGEKWAERNRIPVKRFPVLPADWAEHGARAAYLRNLEMAKYATACIVFWDGKSKGAEMMYQLALEHLPADKVYLRLFVSHVPPKKEAPK